MIGEGRLDAEARATLAERLYEADRTGVGIDPPSDTLPLTLPDAYRVRRLFVDRLLADGRALRGHKIGFTSKAMQEMYGIDQPDFGQLTDDMFVPPSSTIDASRLCDARVEPEIAFELAAPVRGPGATVDQVLDATRCVRAAIEVINSRVGGGRARGVDSIADNGGAGRMVLGEVALGPRDLDLAALEVAITVDGETLTGRGEAALGHPAAAIVWLANRLAEIAGLGGQLEAGDIVMTGSVTRSLPVAAGSSLRAVYGPLGAIDLHFS